MVQGEPDLVQGGPLLVQPGVSSTTFSELKICLSMYIVQIISLIILAIFELPSVIVIFSGVVIRL